MELHPSRLRRGELIVGASAVLLLVFALALKWYGVSGGAATARATSSLNGWQGLAHVRWVMLVTIVAALGLVLLQAARQAPALPVTMSVIVTVLALLTVVLLGYRDLINTPREVKVGAYLGLLSAVALAYGGYESMRHEGISPKDAPTIETVDPGSAESAG